MNYNIIFNIVQYIKEDQRILIFSYIFNDKDFKFILKNKLYKNEDYDINTSSLTWSDFGDIKYCCLEKLGKSKWHIYMDYNYNKKTTDSEQKIDFELADYTIVQWYKHQFFEYIINFGRLDMVDWINENVDREELLEFLDVIFIGCGITLTEYFNNQPIVYYSSYYWTIDMFNYDKKRFMSILLNNIREFDIYEYNDVKNMIHIFEIKVTDNEDFIFYLLLKYYDDEGDRLLSNHNITKEDIINENNNLLVRISEYESHLSLINDLIRYYDIKCKDFKVSNLRLMLGSIFTTNCERNEDCESCHSMYFYETVNVLGGIWKIFEYISKVKIL